MVVRNCDGFLIHAESTLVLSQSPLLAEFYAIDWAADIALAKGWKKVFWKSDSAVAVKEISSSSDPVAWDTRLEIISIRRKFADVDWKISWTARDSNQAADILAKHCLLNNLVFSCDSMFDRGLPSSFKNQILHDMQSHFYAV